jgi:REP element-mobilizing transposase RayT
MNSKVKQLHLLKPQKTDHGGDLKHPQKRARPLSTKESIHLVLRSTKAKGKLSFFKYKKDIDSIINTFAAKYHIEINSSATLGNHIHLHIKLFKRDTYKKFIRAVTAAIMMKITGFCRDRPKPANYKFWDQRPFTRVIRSFKEFIYLVDYIQINVFEAMGYTRREARGEIKKLRLEFQAQHE